MYPFFVLDVPEDASDEQIKKQYLALIKKYSPDRAPEKFSAIRRAYEAIKNEQARIETRLFYLNAAIPFSPEEIPDTDFVPAQRQRLSPAELSTLLKEIEND